MPVVVVANPKGGVGKTTLSTNIASYWASQGHRVLLGDIDPQQSARLWLSLRRDTNPGIEAWDVQPGFVVSPPAAASHVVLDTPAGLGGFRLRDVIRFTDKVIIPMQASVYDIFATSSFIDELIQADVQEKVQIGLVAMRLNERTLAAQQLQRFLKKLTIPLLTSLRQTQNYVQLAAEGQGIFDSSPGRVKRDLEQWESLTHWLDEA